MLHLLLTTVAVVWGVSAVAVVTIFCWDERAFRRRAADRPAEPTPTVAHAPAPGPAPAPAPTPDRSRELASSNAG